jgi:hypothetical protein
VESESGRCDYHQLGFLDRTCLARSPVTSIHFSRASRVDILQIRCNPIFVRPILDNEEGSSDASDTKQASTGRRKPVTQHGTPNIPRPRTPISKFQELSLLSIISMTGHVPQFPVKRTTSFSLKDIIKRANRPVVVLPECTTSNGRGLLRFSSVFRQRIPVKEYQVFVMGVRSVSRACNTTLRLIFLSISDTTFPVHSPPRQRTAYPILS